MVWGRTAGWPERLALSFWTRPPVWWTLPSLFPFLRSRGHWTFYSWRMVCPPNFTIAIQHMFNSALMSSISSASICPLPPIIHSKPDSTASTADITPFPSLSKDSNVGQVGHPFSKLPGHDCGWDDFAPVGIATLTWLIPLVDYDWSCGFNLCYTAEFVWNWTVLRVE